MSASTGIGQQTKAGIAYTSAGRAGAAVVVFGGTVVLARLLAVRDFGVIQLCFMLVDFATKVGDFGFGSALVQRREEVSDEHTTTLFWIDFSIKLALFAGLLAGLPRIAGYFREPRLLQVLPAVAAYMVVDCFSVPGMTLLARRMDFRRSARIEFIARSCETVSAVLMAFAGFGVWSLVGGRLIGSVLSSVMSMSAARWRPSFNIDIAGSRDLIRFGGWLFCRNLFYYLGDNVDYFVVGRTLGSVQLGYYSKAFEIMRLPQGRITRAVNAVLFSAFSRVQGQRDKVCTGLQKSIMVTALVSYPLLIGLALVAPEFVELVLGAKWQPMVLPLQIMCLAGVIHAVDPFVVSVFTALGYVRLATGRRFVELLCLAAGAYVGSRFGIAGVSVAVVIVSVMMIGVMALLMRTIELDAWRDYLRPQRAALVATLAMVVAVVATRRAIGGGMGSLGLLFVLISVGAASYAVAVWALRFKEVVALMDEARGDLRRLRKRGK